VLIEGGFTAFAEATCKPYYAAKMGAPSIPLGRYFQMQWSATSRASIASGDRVALHGFAVTGVSAIPHI
jgi:hypothetical protein